MAEIKPFRAWRYNRFLKEKLFELSAPLTETAFQQSRAALYQQPFHNFHIASPRDVPPYENVKRRVETWKLDQVIKQDALPAMYVYFQYFHLQSNLEKRYCRKGFISFIKAEDYADKIILPHEKTIERAVAHRKTLLEYTQMHTNPTHGFYTDKNLELESYLDESIQNPIYELRDENDTLHILSIIQDSRVIKKFMGLLEQKKIWIADGHHRYESSMIFKNEQKAQNPDHSGGEAYNYHMMYLTNTESSDLGILPTHRIVHSLKNFRREDFIQKLLVDFNVKELESVNDWDDNRHKNPQTFVLLFKDKNYQITLKEEAFLVYEDTLPDALKRLDISVMHKFILEKIPDFEVKTQFKHLDFSQDSIICQNRLRGGSADFAVLTHKISLEDIENVCLSGYTMPAKATYFFPKVLGGLLFGSIKENES